MAFLVALALRLAVAMTMDPAAGDQTEYLAAATRVLDGQPVASLIHSVMYVRPPGYALFIATIWSIASVKTLLAIRLAQAALSTATCVMVYVLALRIRDNRRTALVAFCLSAVYPYFLYQVATIGSECVFSFLVALGTYFFARGLEKKGIVWGYVVGAVIVYAAGILVRPNLAPIEALLGLFLAWRYRHRWRTVVALGAVMVAGTLLLTVPWNLAVERQGLGKIFVSDGGGVNYYVGHSDFAVRIYCEHTSGLQRAAIAGNSWHLDPVMFMVHTLPRSEQARLFWRTALHWDAQHPSREPCLAAGKLWSFWRPWVEPVYPWKLVALSLGSLPLLVLGLAGLWSRRSDSDTALASVVAAHVVGGSIVAMVYMAEVRYRIPGVDLLLVPYAASMAADLVRRGLGRRGQPAHDAMNHRGQASIST